MAATDEGVGRLAGARTVRLGDLWGGVAATAVALPQSMGLGVVLLTGIGLEPSRGAMAGLLGAAVLCLCSGLAGATRGMISAPNGPVTLLLVASLASLAAGGTAPGALPAALAAILVIGGGFQALLGATRGGHMVKLIPFPVVAGLVTSVGILMIRSQVPVVIAPAAGVEGVWRAVPALTVLITLAAIRLTPILVPRLPGVIGGFVLGIAGFHLLAAIQPGPIPAAWVVGEIPALGRLAVLPEPALWRTLPWGQIVAASAALAVVASIDCLLTAVVADGRTDGRHDARRELIAQGTAQLIAALLGGVGGGGTKGSTLVAIAAGGSRRPALVAGVLFLSLLLFAGRVGLYLPLGVLAGVIIYVGIEMIDLDILGWLQHRRLRTDALVALAVVTTTVAYNLLVGVAVGVVGSVLLFVLAQLRLPVIHERSTGRTRRSLKARDELERRLLDEHGDRIVYVELRGNLFFGTAEQVFDQLHADLRRPIWLVLNMRRVQHVDSSAIHIFRQMAARLARHGGTMVYANVFKHIGGVRKMNKAFRQLGRIPGLPKVKTFPSTDAALEYAEDRLLESLGHAPPRHRRRVAVEDNALCAGLGEATRALLAATVRPLLLPRKALVFARGDPGDAIYLVARGEVEIRLPTGRYHYKRLAKIGPGGYFGEGGFLTPGRRSASAYVTRRARLYVLDREALLALEARGEHEAVRRILEAVARTVVAKLHWARAELDRLEQR